MKYIKGSTVFHSVAIETKDEIVTHCGMIHMTTKAYREHWKNNKKGIFDGKFVSRHTDDLRTMFFNSKPADEEFYCIKCRNIAQREPTGSRTSRGRRAMNSGKGNA